MQTQADISAARLAKKVGSRIKVLVDSVENGYAVARSSADAPEIDGLVYIESTDGLAPGEFAEVTVNRADTHDLYARPL